jgi:hypothetical protein
MYICYLQDGALFQFGGFTMRFVYDFNDSLNSYSSRILFVHSDGMSLMRKMEKDSLGNQEEMPFKEPEMVPTIEPNLLEKEQAQSPPEPVIAVAPEAGALDTVSSQGQDDKEITPNVSELFDYLQQGMQALRGLNLEGFRQIYPVFLSIFGAFLLGLALLITINFLQSINQLPLLGGVIEGAAELIGFVALVRFVTFNLLRQQKRAELLTRIAVLKKKLLG